MTKMRLLPRVAAALMFGLGACQPVCPPCANAPEPAAADAPEASRAPEPPATDFAFRDPSLPDERRLDSLIAALTLDEKVKCLGTDPSIPRLGIRASDHVEGLHGLALGGPGGWGGKQPLPTTMFPQAVGLAATWDPELVRRVAAVEGLEARLYFHGHRRGALVVRAPNADLGRDPRWGRSEESYGEDPHLASRMAVAFVRGLQGDDPKRWQTAALLKHFVANTNENGRGHTSSNFDARLFHEYYAAAFRAAVREGGARAYMAAYNAVNGVPSTTHPMLRETRERWGQDGIICTDAGALEMLVTEHKAFSDVPRAAAAAVQAGITQFLDDYERGVRKALRQGFLKEAEVDAAIRRTFRVMLRLGLLDPEPPAAFAKLDADVSPTSIEAHRKLAYEATHKSIVLLKNQPALLPIDPKKVRSIAVIGPFVNDVLLDWYSGTPPHEVTPLHGILSRLGAVNSKAKVESALDDRDGAATRIARAADVAVVFVGNHPTGDAGWAQVARASYGKEAVDRRSIQLEDEELVRKVRAANPRTVMVLVSSFPYAIAWSLENVASILHVTHSSQELGYGVADVLFGAQNPAGRLVQTWPRSLEDLPPILDYDIRKGRTYLYATKKPLFPFGFGLGYTRFGYANLRTNAERFGKAAPLVVELDVTNQGARAGDEVVQLYVKHLASGVSRPLQELKAFQRVAFAAKQKKTVELRLAAEDLAYWDEQRRDFVVEPGEIELRVGRSSADIALTKRVRVEP